MSIGQRDYFQIYLREAGERRIIPPMPLSDNEKTALKEQVATLLELNEPESILATLQRVAERMAHSVTRGAITELEAQRWQAVAKACQAVEKELERANTRQISPEGAAAIQNADSGAPVTVQADGSCVPALETPNAA